jgi:hypothetical protein
MEVWSLTYATLQEKQKKNLVNPAEKGWCSIYGFTSDSKVGGAVFSGWYNVYFFPDQALIFVNTMFLLEFAVQ